VRLGAYDLLEVLGRGATGQVWKATYGESIVAVKLLDKGISPEMNQMLTREVHALASLNHPHIVTVLDFGHVSESEATKELSAGQPYVVFEYASRGALDEYLSANPTLSWPWVRHLLFAVLDGLAHAHARNVIHRDLKPANIIGFENPTVWKITDFGLAFLGGEEAKENRIYGTPHYMAPEQFHGDGYLYAPHTDLYALGVLAYQLVCGRLPFNHKTVIGLAQQHLTKAVPSLEPIFPTPPGLEAWIAALLSKDVSRRFELAADAAALLRELPDVAGSSRRSDTILMESPDTLVATMHSAPTEISRDTLPFGETQVMRIAEFGVRPQVAPQPPTWRRARVEFRNPLKGSSARLFSLRARELVGRDRELEQLWTTLVQVRRRGSVRCTVITGADGVGKTALAKWFAERAAETGAATVVELGQDAWTTMYRHARASDDPELQRAVLLRTASELDAEDLLPIWLSKVEVGDTALISYLRAYGLRRPVILVVDGLGNDPFALKLVGQLLRANSMIPHAVHVVATSREISDAFLRNEVQTLMRDAETLELHNLPRLASNELLRQVLKFDVSATDRLQAMSNGNPRILFDVIEDWGDRGLLVETPDGFAVEGNPTSNLGDALRLRVEEVLSTSGRRNPLIRAAVLGGQVNWAEWTHVCRAAGIPVEEDLVSVMVRRGLAMWTEDGFSFAHGMMRELILAGVDVVAISNQAAIALARLQELRPLPERWGRIGELYMAAHRPADAIEPLRLGAEDAFRRAHFFERRRLSRLRLECANIQANPYHIALATVEYGVSRRGTYESEDIWFWDEIDAARLHGWNDVLGAALLATSTAARMEHRFDASAEWASEAMRAFEMIPDPIGYAKALRNRADSFAYGDHFEESQRDYLEALSFYEQEGHEEGMAWCDFGLGYIAQQWGDQEKALMHLQRGAEWYRSHGYVGNAAAIDNSIGDSMYQLGRFTEAIFYAESSVHLNMREGRNVPEGHANLALAYLALGDVESFTSKVVVVARDASHQPHFSALYACVAALERDWVKWDELLVEISQNFTYRGVDLAQALDAMSHCAELVGAPTRSQHATALADAQWERVRRVRVVEFPRR
jgi:serine/threonine protein kinase/tetratricopeptide (TPR) repeat protein